MNNSMKFLVNTNDNGKRIDTFLASKIDNLTRSYIKKLIETNCVKLNNVNIDSPSKRIKSNDEIDIKIDYRNNNQLEPKNINLNIIYDDKDILVINKPKGMVVHPGAGNKDNTLANALAYKYKSNLSNLNGELRPGIVHRIDKDTSGLLVIAKTEFAMTNLAKQFFDKTTERIYNALVWGDFEEDKGTFEGAIGRHPKNRLQMSVYEDNSKGKEAITHFKVLERFRYVTLVECQLETGRTHQIRAHMKHFGHTLFNDSRYGGDSILKGTSFSKYRHFIENCFKILPRQALHAKTLGFKHPLSGEDLQFDSQLPKDFMGVLKKWRSYIASKGI